jgi:Putative Ig domain
MSMRQIIKSFLGIVFLAFGLQAAWGFALLGPLPGYPGLPANFGDSWQTPVIDYGFGEVGGPKNIGEEYRRNTPVLYYAYDANFLDFFGSNGVSAVDGAFNVLNNAFTNNFTGMTNGLDGYSLNLSEFPCNSQSINYTAQSAGLLDLKSFAMFMLMEQLGLAEPEFYVWALHDRYLPSQGKCPEDELYLVVQRNFDFMPTPLNQLQYSSYVNGTLYSYIIEEACTGPNPLAATLPFSPDPFASTYTAVAGLGDGLNLGGFYTGLTRDDVAGLRYLLTTNNVNWESSAAGSALIGSTTVGVTNLSSQSLLYTSNYNAFLMAAQTNGPTILSNLFPGLVILTSSNTFTYTVTPNVISYYTNVIGAPVGSPPVLVVRTNSYTTNALEIYFDTFANVVVMSNGYRPTTTASLVTVSVGAQIGAPVGSPLVTNTTTKTVILTNQPSGEFYINTNYLCGPDVIVSPQPAGFPIAIVTAATNVLYVTSNSAGFFSSQSLVIYSTTHVYVVQQPICSTTTAGSVTNGPGLYQGIGKVQFVSAPFDSLLGQTFQPVTNIYTMTLISGSKAQRQTFRRVATAPDIVFSAQDMASPKAPEPPRVISASRNINFNVNNILAGLAGPGTINPPTTIILEKVGDIYLNGSLAAYSLSTNQFLSELTQGNNLLAWASFDSSTNDPVVYPNGTSIQNLENQILVQLAFSPSTADSTLPNGASGQPYTPTTFTASGGAFSPPFTWSATGLPAGLTVATNTGVLSGTPTQSGTFDFTLTLTDVISRSVQWTLAITIQ